MRSRDLLDLTLLAAIWGASFLFQRIASPEFGPFPLVLIRVGIGAAVLLPVLFARRDRGAWREHWRALIVVGAINSAIPFSLFAFATLHVSASMAAILNGTAPLFGGLIGLVAFGERVGLKRALGLGLGFAGIVLLVWQDLGQPSALRGMAAGLLAAACYGFAVHYTRRHLKAVPPLVIAGATQLSAAILLAVPAVFSWPAQVPPIEAWGSALALGALCTGAAYALYFRLISRAGPSTAMLVAYLIPVFGMLWGRVFLGEHITSTVVIGCAVVLAGVAIAAPRSAPIRQNS